MVLNNIANMVNKMVVPQQVNMPSQVQGTPGQNPFSNPFVTNNATRQNSYGKNQPVFGGFFAGRIRKDNGKYVDNIVGQRIWITA